MDAKRKIEIFSAGCPICEDTIELVHRIASDSDEVTVLDMKEPGVASRAKSLGIGAVPAVAVDGKLSDCCTWRGPDERSLRRAGVGRLS